MVAEAETGTVVVDENATKVSPEVRAFLQKWIDSINITDMLIEMVRRDAQRHYERADGFIFPEPTEPTALAIPEK